MAPCIKYKPCLCVKRTSCSVSYRVEPLATGRPLWSVWDTLCSSASEPARHPSSDTLPSVLLKHLQMGGKEVSTNTIGFLKRNKVSKSSHKHNILRSSTQKKSLRDEQCRYNKHYSLILFIQASFEESILFCFLSSGWIISV